MSVAYVPNATDFTGANPEKVRSHIEMDTDGLREIGFQPTLLDLKTFFEDPFQSLR